MKLKFCCCGLGLGVTLLLLALLATLAAGTGLPRNRSACGQPKSAGLCRGKLLRYAYNAETGNCVSFYYTGCGATENNFLTFEECRRDCMQKLRY